ncbi:MAG: hypothetical protein NHB15_09840 [Methanosarcina barkeri]|nr:hypothetical protein [Methanosarcina sp. ERenArc_MAG2]
MDTLRTEEKNSENLQAKTEDLKAQVHTLYHQLHTRDEQIEKLNENMCFYCEKKEAVATSVFNNKKS